MHRRWSLLDDPLVLPESVADLSKPSEQLLLCNIGIVAEFIDVLLILFIGMVVQVSHIRDLSLAIRLPAPLL